MSKKTEQPIVTINWKKLVPILIGLALGFALIIMIKIF